MNDQLRKEIESDFAAEHAMLIGAQFLFYVRKWKRIDNSKTPELRLAQMILEQIVEEDPDLSG